MLPLLALASACDTAGEASEPGDLSATRVDLSRAFPASAVLVGVAITPDGTRYVLDQSSGLYELHGSSARLVVDTKALNLEPTDVVALDSEHLALTAVNDGFLVNLTTLQLSSYFCYLPADLGNDAPIEPTNVSVSQSLRAEGIAVDQRTESVAFNPETRMLFAQPRTTRLDTGEVVGSELFVFAEQGGQPIRVVPVADRMLMAGGMVAAADSRLFLGVGDRIFEAMPEGPVVSRKELGEGVHVSGMARDFEDVLWYLDGPARELVELGSTLVSR